MLVGCGLVWGFTWVVCLCLFVGVLRARCFEFTGFDACVCVIGIDLSLSEECSWVEFMRLVLSLYACVWVLVFDLDALGCFAGNVGFRLV